MSHFILKAQGISKQIYAPIYGVTSNLEDAIDLFILKCAKTTREKFENRIKEVKENAGKLLPPQYLVGTIEGWYSRKAAEELFPKTEEIELIEVPNTPIKTESGEFVYEIPNHAYGLCHSMEMSGFIIIKRNINDSYIMESLILTVHSPVLSELNKYWKSS